MYKGGNFLRNFHRAFAEVPPRFASAWQIAKWDLSRIYNSAPRFTQTIFFFPFHSPFTFCVPRPRFHTDSRKLPLAFSAFLPSFILAISMTKKRNPEILTLIELLCNSKIHLEFDSISRCFFFFFFETPLQQFVSSCSFIVRMTFDNSKLLSYDFKISIISSFF